MRIVAGFCLLALIACRRESRELRPSPARVSTSIGNATQGSLWPGGIGEAATGNPLGGVAAAAAEGQRLFSWYNCSGCHANGGGGIGPPLIKNEWIYGGEPANIFDSIAKGRPNGMPIWGKKVPEYQIWQLVAYVRALNNQDLGTFTPPRADTIQADTSSLQNRGTGTR